MQREGCGAGLGSLRDTSAGKEDVELGQNRVGPAVKSCSLVLLEEYH